MKNLPLWEAAPSLRLVVYNRHPRRAEQEKIPYHAHRHDFYELGLVLDGQCAWRLPRRRPVLQTGDVILVKPGTRHREEPAPRRELKLGWIGFEFEGTPPPWVERAIALGEDLPEVEMLFRAIYAEHSSTDPLTRRHVGLALQNVLVLVARRARPMPPMSSRPRRGCRLSSRQVRALESAAHYFRHNFRDTLSIAQVAAYHSFCPPYFSTLFRRHFRTAPRTFLQQVKIEHAAELLKESSLTLKEIGARCGFTDAAHLAKAFKKRLASTPGAYRRRHARAGNAPIS